MNVAVIDLGFGDSGKGTVVAYLCNDNYAKYSPPVVVRFSGGHQAGHTVVKDGLRHIFSSMGSGTLQGVPTYWSKKCTFYPTAFLNEMEVLKDKFPELSPEVFVDPECPVTTFYDVMYNRKVDGENHHGSCGVGFGATLEREEKFYSLLVGDLRYPSVVKEKLKLIKEYYGGFSGNDETFLRDCKEALTHIFFTDDMPGDINDVFGFKIYEGSQGLLLDQNIGFFPHVTRSNVGSKAIDDHLDAVYYVTRAYQTRHGNGPMTNEPIEHKIAANPNETNVTNFQGTFRRTILDLDLLEYAIKRDNTHAKIKNLVITCLDHIENDLRFTHKDRVVRCIDQDQFVKYIYRILDNEFGIDNVYISNSEEYKNIEKYI